MAYDGNDWTRSKGWEVEDVFDSSWGLNVTPTPDRLKFHGDGTGSEKNDDVMTKNGGALATGCTYSVVSTVEQVEVSFNKRPYIIRLDASVRPKMLTCVEKGLSSGNASWTAVEGG